MSYSVIVFDTAPTGHTLRLLSFPSVLERAFEKFSAVKEKFGGLFAQVSGLVQPATEQKLMGKLEQAKATIDPHAHPHRRHLQFIGPQGRRH